MQASNLLKPDFRVYGRSVVELLTELRANLPFHDGKFQVVVPDYGRISLAIFFGNDDGKVLLITRDAQHGIPEGYPFPGALDAPVASRGYVPDSTFKVGNMLDQAEVLELFELGIAMEEAPAPDDAPKVTMPCFLWMLGKDELQRVADAGKGVLMSPGEIIALAESHPEMLTSKVHTLAKWLKDEHGADQLEGLA